MGRISRFAWSAIFLIVFIFAFSYAPAAAQQTEQQGSTSEGQPQSQNQYGSQRDGAAKQDAAGFNEFLDQHPYAEKQLKANPYLINDPNFLSTQPELKAYLVAHPEIKNQLEQSPVDFMRRETGTRGAGAGVNAPKPPSASENYRELGRMDEFLDEHRDVEQQLALNPSLISDQNYLAQHHALALFLSAHPDIRGELAANPGYFMQRESQPGSSAGSESAPPRSNAASVATGVPADRGREVGEMDQFLDEHANVKKDLQQRPVLINDGSYLAQHPELGLFLDGHPAIRLDFSEHPEMFVAVIKPEPASGPPTTTGDVGRTRSNAAPENANRELESREATRMAQFLDDHPNIHKDLEKNPWLVNQSKYLKHHKEMERFLSEHPEIREKLADNPTYFAQHQNGVLTANTSGGGTTRPFQPQFNNIDLELVNRFLEKHKKTAKELGSDPALVTSQHYIDHNKDLRNFFDVHPHILEEFRQSPRAFMDQENQLRAELR